MGNVNKKPKKSVVRGEGLYHGVMGGNADPEGFTRDLRPGISMMAMVFIRLMPEVEADLNEPSKSDGQKGLVLPIADLLDQAQR